MAESKELNRIKKLYGEKFMHLCRRLFPTLLEQEGLLTQILEENFSTNSRTLGEDITEKMEEEFKNFIFSKVDVEKEKIEIIVKKTPYELLEEAGYELYECTSEEEIQSFKKYYKLGEELCTFNGGRLGRCVVFWAVKKDVDKILRKNFKEPKREDEYGTSVMSIQFTRGENSTVSIKNRYNHTVDSPDATYGNDLDRIAPGLTQSFANLLARRGMKLDSSNIEKLYIPNYVVANDGKYYKYNMEINGIYYCPGNVIIDHGEVKQLESEKEVLMDYFILDKEKKTLRLYDSRFQDSFVDSFENIEKIEMIKNPDKEKQTRLIKIKIKDSDIPAVIEIDKDNNIVGYENQELKQAGDYFLEDNLKLKELNLPQLTKVGYSFLGGNKELSQLDLPQLEEVGNDFLYFNKKLSEINLPQLKKVGVKFLYKNNYLRRLDLPQLIEVGLGFLYYNKELSQLNLPQLEEVSDLFFLSHPQREQIIDIIHKKSEKMKI